MKKLKYKIAGEYGGQRDAVWIETAVNYYYGEKVIELNKTKDIKEADFLVLTGGSDINPIIYNHTKHSSTYFMERRDEAELADAKMAMEMKIPMFGICRGAQMLCALAGGTLVQDVINHHGHHDVMILNEDIQSFFKGTFFTTNSIHHQMMNPFNLVENEDYTLIAVCDDSISNGHYLVSENNQDKNLNKMSHEPESVYFNKIKGYAVQWHPEMLNEASNFVVYTALHFLDITDLYPMVKSEPQKKSKFLNHEKFEGLKIPVNNGTSTEATFYEEPVTIKSYTTSSTPGTIDDKFYVNHSYTYTYSDAIKESIEKAQADIKKTIETAKNINLD